MKLTHKQQRTLVAMTLGRQDIWSRVELCEVVTSETDPTSPAGVGETLSSLVRRDLVDKREIRGVMNYWLTDHGRAVVHCIAVSAS